MASFIKRNGSWTARIRKRGYPETTQTFASKASAMQWSQRVESDPEKFLTEQVSADHQLVTLGDLVRKYGEEVTPTKKGRHKEKYRLRILQRSLLSGVSLRNLKSHYVQRRQTKGGLRRNCPEGPWSPVCCDKHRKDRVGFGECPEDQSCLSDK